MKMRDMSFTINSSALSVYVCVCVCVCVCEARGGGQHVCGQLDFLCDVLQGGGSLPQLQAV